ncbi:unnamed protein product [Phyllotreta striolata]|uniref:Histone-lysine N-methyltransferase ash1 n=1 Tax=Phyllotreta striolata TaxID=444603 RepID=A0A9N9TLP8_PHYSR|nr:unnamed protein product [Phyllotreta striolata]
MATNDGTTAELFPGWSSVVHRPAEEPEEIDLPSTVDIAALTNTEPVNDRTDSDNDSDAESSNSDASQSRSQSDDSSDSDSSSSSQGSSSERCSTPRSPEFAVTSSPTGLRLTIRKASATPEPPDAAAAAAAKSASSSSDSSSGSDSDSERSERRRRAARRSPVRQTRRLTAKARAMVADRKEEKAARGAARKEKDGAAAGGARAGNVKLRATVRRTRKMASLPLSRGSAYTTSDDSEASDADSAMLAACSLQEIRQEDLAAILPDQQEIDASGCGAGDASGSDMELPQQAVNALIQRTTESSSDGESNAQPLYANNLLQQFVAQMQLLNNAPCPTAAAATPDDDAGGATGDGGKGEQDGAKKKRGRPKKCDKEADKSQEYCANPNVSPDSGIQNSPDHVSSPEPVVLSPTAKLKSGNKKIVNNNNNNNNNNNKVKPVTRTTNNGSSISSSSKNKIPVTSTRFDRAMYGNTERVLYPPRRLGNVRKGPGRPPKHKSDTNKAMKEKKCKQQQQQQQQAKFQTLKIPKLMHSKRKHKKHKKCKIKIVKPLSHQHPKAASIEIDKLIDDFAAYCSIRHRDAAAVAAAVAKKPTKKRKAGEHGDKKKKRCDATAVDDDKPADADEQRLPLKKRHYHHVNEEEVEAAAAAAAATGRSDDHIDEAIEACINRYADGASASIAATPKKRHRLEEKIAVDEKVTIESFISELKAKRNLTGKADDGDAVAGGAATSTVVEGERKVEAVGEAGVKASPESAKKKVRKRRAFNRTGFPTVRRKKKKPSEGGQTAAAAAAKSTEAPDVCERVPKEGEQYSEFVQRTETADGEKSKPDDPFKWEAMSECESLPQDERIDFDEDVKPDRMSLRHRDAASPSSSVEPEHSLESSIERLRSRLEERGKRKRRDKEKAAAAAAAAASTTTTTASCSSTSSSDVSANYPKRKLRDGSPALRRLKDDRSSTSGDEKRARRTSRWRKKYLLAGLFSDYYKEDDEAIRLKRVENAAKPTRIMTYNPEEHPYGLLPPPYHCGRYLRCRKIPFQLPYDIWWQHTNSQLPGRDIVPSWNYRKIRSNIYNVKNSTGACEPQPCNCKPTSNCGDDCINRLVFAECPSSHRCHNQKIQRHDWKPGLEKFMTESKGWGVRTKHSIKKGEFILEYVGEVVADQEFKERMGGVYANDTHHYCLHLDGGLVIDGHRMGSDGRFVNHSCDPNCEMQKWSVNGQFRMALFSLRDIDDGEELTYDYNFSLFNPAEGQECKCGSETCRGVIGGKSQRVRQLPEPQGGAAAGDKKAPGRVGRPRKTEAKKKSNGAGAGGGAKEADRTAVAASLLPLVQIKPMSHQQKCFILEHHCFLLRNLAKVRKVRDRSMSASSRMRTATPTDTSVFMNQLNALQKPRNMKTRKLAQAEDDPELNKTIKLASLLKEIWTAVVTAKDSKGAQLSAELMSLPSKRKVPELYASMSNPIDLSIIEQNIATGVYKTPESFDSDFESLFRNFVRFYGRTSDVGVAATKLKKIYGDSKRERLEKFERALGEKPSPKFASNRKKSEEEDIIRCICGIPRDEGLMIQCERCMVWQHCECVKADASAASYHCENCTPRQVDYEIPLDEFTEHGHRYYMTLMRGDLQLRQGDTVYVLRDIPIKGTDKKHTYDTIGKIDYAELDIFRIERLWKEEKTGKRLAYGHHYLRPHETFHEPTRKFFPNEVMRVPLYEAVPVELIISHCWVMDLNTFCKGRPIGAAPDHIYICEYRVDKGAKMFSKVSKSKFPICTKSFAFEHFETRLKISRTYCPHDVDESLLKNAAGRRQKNDDGGKPSARDKGGGGGGGCAATAVVKNETVVVATPPVVRTLVERKGRLNRILLNLLGKLPAKQVYDASYLLEGGRRRKKTMDNNK